MKRLTVCFLAAAWFLAVQAEVTIPDYDKEDDKDKDAYACKQGQNCVAPKCRCRSRENPGKRDLSQVPQFVMLTFDDAVNAANFDFYKELLLNTHLRNPSGCRIAATFFVSHEYNNYFHLNELYRYGNEIATHSISHESSTDTWKKAPMQRWVQEFNGMREIIHRFGQIPKDQIVGIRAPFLQTAGNVTFQMLKDMRFLYDSSLPTQEEKPFWPYTFDFGLAQECTIEPCPTQNQPGLWVVPMNSMRKLRVIDENTGKTEIVPCAMADACLPYPETAGETTAYLMENFRRFNEEKIPFPVFLHESWLKNTERRKGYLDFVKQIRQNKDVYVVSIKEVIQYMLNPAAELSKYKENICIGTPLSSPCDTDGRFCNFETTPLKSPRVMYTCTNKCPVNYPWLGNPAGK